MSKTPFIPPMPHIDPPDEETLEALRSADYKEFKKSDAYKKCVKPTLDREKRLKRQARKEWWKVNWIGISTLIIGLLTLIATVGFGLVQVLR